MSNESLSALLDGECSDAELSRLLDAMESNPALGQRWSQWHLRREIAEGTAYRRGQVCICAAVMAGLEEPVSTGKVVDMSAWRRRLRAVPWKPAVGLAAAASVGAAAVMFISPAPEAARGSSESQAGTELPSLGVGSPLSVPVGGSTGAHYLQSVSLSGEPVVTEAPMFADDEYAALLREYLINHSNSLAEQGVGGTLRYARFAAHTTTASTGYRLQPIVVEEFETER